MLTQESESDYVLPEGESCWVTVGNTSIYITNKAGVNGQCIAVFRANHEMDEVLTTIDLEPLQ